jgi:asparagine synthase (glutamine-hydrolysing)
MCGINGIALVSRARAQVDPDTLVRMRDVMTHRGPDDQGLFVNGPIGLGHRRLSIVDLATGQQPMANEDGSLHIVFNGEIYNHLDFRPGLEARGHHYRTKSDTETILHLYEDHGAGVVERLRGMFAIAIWDEAKQELFLARDRLGIKPLYYVLTPDGSLYFASEIKALLAAGAVKAELNVPALPDYLANHATSGEETLFARVKRLLPGHTLLWRDGQVTIRRFWDIPAAQPEDGGKTDGQLIDEWRELFRASVKLRLMSDVPLGMFLSGGIDSSAIAAMMSGMVTEPIKTFSVAFHEPEANELEFARAAARAFKTDHHEVVVTPSEFFAALPELVWHEDEPIAHPSSIALAFVSRLAKEHVTVVLTGEGSDELLAGYARYRKTLLNLALGRSYARMTTEGLRGLVRRSAGSLVAPRTLSRLKRTFLWNPPDVEHLYFDAFAVFPRSMQPALLNGRTLEQLGGVDPYAGMRACFDRDRDASLLSRLLYTDLKTYLHELLMKQDQMSMAASIESRVPFLDHKLVEFTTTLPDRLKLKGWTTKYVLREAMKGLVPEPILNRPKMGFPVPIGKWLRGSERHIVGEYVLGERAASRGLFDKAFVQKLVQEHQSGAVDHSERLWSLVNLELWQRVFLDG